MEEVPRENERKLSIISELSPLDFLDTKQSWLLVPSGSIGGFFDYVPVHLRVGPWSSFAPPYLFSLSYILALWACFSYKHGVDSSKNVLSDEFPPVGSTWWYFNMAIFLWMSLVALLTFHGPLGAKGWATFSMWTFSAVHLRIGFCAVVPLFPGQRWLVDLAEFLRFPALQMATVVFVLWNFVIGPFVLFLLKDEAKRARYLKYFVSWRLIQIHVFVLPFSVVNVLYASPRRRLSPYPDILMICAIGILYFLFYLLILDRIGVHLYPAFSPRSSKLVLGGWSMIVLLLAGGYICWGRILPMPEIET